MRDAGPLADEPGLRSGDELIRSIAVIGLAGIATGLLVGGFASRLFMRFAAIVAGDAVQGRVTEADAIVGRITSDGTTTIVLFVGFFSGIVGAVLYAIFRPWLGRAGRYRGLAFGVVLFAIASATSDVMNPDNFDFALLGNAVLLITMIVLLFLAFGLVLDGLSGAFGRRLPTGDDAHRRPPRVYMAIAAVGVGLAVLAMPPFLFFGSSCDCDPPIVASIFVVVAATGTLLSWAGRIRSGSERVLPIARTLGFLGLSGTLVFGLWRAGSDALDIITAAP